MISTLGDVTPPAPRKSLADPVDQTAGQEHLDLPRGQVVADVEGQPLL